MWRPNWLGSFHFLKKPNGLIPEHKVICLSERVLLTWCYVKCYLDTSFDSLRMMFTMELYIASMGWLALLKNFFSILNSKIFSLVF